jgi:hypothetical protein
MFVRCVTLATAIGVATAQTAVAADVSMGKLVPYCSALEQMVDMPTGGIGYPVTGTGMDATYCAAYIRGILAVIEFGPVKEVRICFPANVDDKQIAAVFVKYAKNHPEWHHWPAVYGVTNALQDAFPCKGEQAH